MTLALLGLGDTASRVWLIVAAVVVVAGLVAWMVVLVHNARLDQQQADEDWRAAGHVPPETDPEKTLMIPIVREAVDMQRPGRHSVGVATVPLADLLAELRERELAGVS